MLGTESDVDDFRAIFMQLFEEMNEISPHRRLNLEEWITYSLPKVEMSIGLHQIKADIFLRNNDI